MISIIICARNNDITPILRENIGQTIGIEYEIIVIDNSYNQYNIFQAYNIGVQQSRFPYLLFMHDDIFYHTDNWGEKVLAYFKNDKVGAVGIAGTPYIPFNPGSWWSAGIGYLYILQSEDDKSPPVLQERFNNYSSTREAVALDGVWFCIRKKLFDVIRFDEDTYNGFHLYDVDISLQVYKTGHSLICIKDVLIHHQSIGALNSNWLEAMHAFHFKWRKELPVSCIQFAIKEQAVIEYWVVTTFISDQLRIKGFDRKTKRKIFLSALKGILLFKKGLLYYKTPFWALQIALKYIKTFF